jgi:hypothetical protein
MFLVSKLYFQTNNGYFDPSTFDVLVSRYTLWTTCTDVYLYYGGFYMQGTQASLLIDNRSFESEAGALFVSTDQAYFSAVLGFLAPQAVLPYYFHVQMSLILAVHHYF